MTKRQHHIGIGIMDSIVSLLFRWDKLRNAIIDEVHMYDEIDKVLSDTESRQIASSVYSDMDGWRGWTINTDINVYYFNDIPEDSCMKAYEQLNLMEIRAYRLEFDIDEIW